MNIFRKVGGKLVTKAPHQIKESGFRKSSLCPVPVSSSSVYPSYLQGIGVAAFSLATMGIPTTGQLEYPGTASKMFHWLYWLHKTSERNQTQSRALSRWESLYELEEGAEGFLMAPTASSALLSATEQPAHHPDLSLSLLPQNLSCSS